MNKKIARVLFILPYFLWSISAVANPDDSESIQMACLAKSNENSAHLQNVLEHWVTTARSGIGDYQARIRELEISGGVFSYELVPELVGLGLVSHEQAKFSESSKAFQRALHIVRVNEGLYSEKQLPLLDLIIENSSAEGEWKQVANSYDMIHWIYRRNYEDSDPRQLQALKRLRRWYMESYNKDTGRGLEELFTTSEKLYEQAIRIMWTCTQGDKRQALCFWHKDCCSNEDATGNMCPLDRG